MCNIATNLTIGCADETANAGFSKMYLKADEEVVSVTFGASTAHTVTAVTLADGALWVEFNGRFATKSIASEVAKENGGAMYTHTLEVFVPKVEKTKAEFLANLDKIRGVVAIAEMYENAGSNKQGLFFGWDKKIGKDAFLKPQISQMVEATVNGQNGYMVQFIGNSTELTREFIGTITVEDGATGTSVVIGS
jgi:hypothetical protein